MNPGCRGRRVLRGTSVLWLPQAFGESHRRPIPGLRARRAIQGWSTPYVVRGSSMETVFMGLLLIVLTRRPDAWLLCRKPPRRHDPLIALEIFPSGWVAPSPSVQ